MAGIHLGVTGSRSLERIPDGRLDQALGAIRDIVQKHGLVFIHHGDCVGFDALVHQTFCHHPAVVMIVHPPSRDHHRAWCVSGERVRIEASKGYMERNQDIVDCSDILVALPSSATEVVRSGSWATIRRARKAGVETVVN